MSSITLPTRFDHRPLQDPAVEVPTREEALEAAAEVVAQIAARVARESTAAVPMVVR